MPVPRDVLEKLFEGAPRFVSRLEAAAAYSWADLFDRAEEIARSMPEEDQVELLDSHPRIGADPATVSALSFREQGYDREPGDGELRARLEKLNEAYERRFGFRFVVFVAGRPREEIADFMEQQLGESREGELRRALRDVMAIARDRADKLAPTSR